MRLKLFLFLTVTILILSGTANEAFAQLKGNATYYANKFHGRLTSDGSVYHKDSLTCAHRTLPFGTVLRVVNKRNGKEVVVKVNDRGPFRPGAIIDLSLAAAKEIGMLHAGIVPVLAYKVKPEVPGKLQYVPESITLPDVKVVDSMKEVLQVRTKWTALHRDESLRPRYRILEENLTAKKF